MNVVDQVNTKNESRVARLRSATHATHNRLDQQIMSAEPFASRTTYGRFLQVQYCFHRDIDALYRNQRLATMLPDLKNRARLDLIIQDLGDLRLAVPVIAEAPIFGASDVDVATGLGWLYVAEGSNLGAAFLLKEAVKLGLSEVLGARHLAAAPEGGGLHWKTFTAALDSVSLTAPEEERVIAGACAAFDRVQRLADESFAG